MCRTMVPGLALSSSLDGPLDTMLQPHWTIFPEESSSALEEPTPRASVDGTPRLFPEVREAEDEQNPTQPISKVAKLARNFQKSPLINRRRPKSLRTTTGEVVETPASDIFSVGDMVEYYSHWQDDWIKGKVVAVNSGTYDLDCRPGAPKESVRRLMQPTMKSEQQQQQEEKEQQTERPHRRSSSCNDVGLRHLQSTTEVPLFSVGDKVNYYSKRHQTLTPAVVLGRNSDGSYVLDCKRYASALKIQHRGPHRMTGGRDRAASASHAGQNRAASASNVKGSPSRTPKDHHSFAAGEIVEYQCHVRGGWVNATVVSANEDGSYKLDVKMNASPKKLRRAGEEAPFQTRIPEDAFKTRLPVDWPENEEQQFPQGLPQRRQKHPCWPSTP